MFGVRIEGVSARTCLGPLFSEIEFMVPLVSIYKKLQSDMLSVLPFKFVLVEEAY